MIVDSSAVVAIILDEPDRQRYAGAMGAAATVSISAATVVECALVLGPRRRAVLDKLLHEDVRASIVPFDAEQAEVARDAHERYGRGSGSPAKLNYGDCLSYALAKVSGEPLLFKGSDFARTDVASALD